MKPIKETVQSRKGFYIGDVRKVVSEKLKADINSVANTGGGLLKDKATGLEVATTFVSSSIIHGAYQATNGDLFDVYGNAFAVVPVELITATIDKIGTDGRVVFGAGKATFETTEHIIKITLPSSEVIEIDTRKEVHR